LTPALHIGRLQLLRLVPHAGAMCLLDSVISCTDSEIVCESNSHRDPANPLRRDHVLSAIHLAEYAAQATAAHGSLQSNGMAQPGMLAALRDVRLHVRHVQDIPGALTVRAHRWLARKEGSLYEFNVHGDGRMLCEGKIAIALEPA
jgi:predicted hotdog family 3-hydroxylacyl-ACP dehydratase